MTVPSLRLRPLNDAPLRPDGDYVLYWMVAFRRLDWNFALQRAVEQARELGKPLIVLEPLRIGYEWASDRFHRFVFEGMVDQAEGLKDSPVAYYPYLEPAAGKGSGLLEALAQRACAVVTDDYPCFFLPRMQAAVAPRLGVSLEAVDSNGLYPLQDTDRLFTRAHSFRAWLQKKLPPHLAQPPSADPLAGVSLPQATIPEATIPEATIPEATIPEDILQRWPDAAAQLGIAGPLSRDEATEKAFDAFLATLTIDHEVPPAPQRGGAEAAQKVLARFLDQRLSGYGDDRNHPDADGASGLSPYLHFGHVSAHQVFWELAEREEWNPSRLGEDTRGSREGWWGMSSAAEGFLDELITWREIGYHRTAHVENYDRYESLPAWAQKTLAEHAGDPREYLYSLEDFEHARTHDEIWNAAQRQLVSEGVMHNYLRMLWGKKILHWTASPQQAFDIMVELNNKYALDGRDPNSYSGILWVLGLFDRAWGPEREIFGKIRYMTSDSTRRKLKLKRYLQRYGENRALF
ncbi:MAG: deoxyribodipyrimidine photolyase [Acidobacteriota bacterium]